MNPWQDPTDRNAERAGNISRTPSRIVQDIPESRPNVSSDSCAELANFRVVFLLRHCFLCRANVRGTDESYRDYFGSSRLRPHMKQAHYGASSSAIRTRGSTAERSTYAMALTLFATISTAMRCVGDGKWRGYPSGKRQGAPNMHSYPACPCAQVSDRTACARLN